jgi:dTMP kinase
MGLLIAFEGIDGSGKTSACNALAGDLKSRGHSVLVVSRTSFVDSAVGRPSHSNHTVAGAKPTRHLGPLSYCVAHCAEFAFAWENTIQPALDAGQIIIADRYKYTAFIRDTIQGVDREYIESLYSFARNPDVIFYLDAEPKTVLERKKKAGVTLSMYEAGLDLFPDLDTDSAFIALQSMCRRYYCSLLPKDNTITVNAMASLNEVQQRIREHAFSWMDKRG